MTPDEIKQARRTLGLTQEQAAELLGYGSTARVYELETGKKAPSDAVQRLLRAYLEGYRPEDWPL